jgi:microcystin-dependent protein
MPIGRVRIPLVVLGPDGRPLAGAIGAVRRRIDAAPVPVYAAETGGTTLTPLQIVTDIAGRMAGWTERDALEAVITPPGGSGLDPYIASWEALPAADSSSEADWHADVSVPGRALQAGGIELSDLSAQVLDLLPQIGDQWVTTSPGDRASGRILMADGRLLSSASYPALDALIGAAAPVATRHAYNNGVDPGSGQFRIPDKRGAASLGADNFGTARGAAGRLPSLAAGDRVLGKRAGLDAITLAIANLPAHNHGGITGACDRSLDHLHPFIENGPASFFITVNGGSGFNVNGYGVQQANRNTSGMDRSIDHLHGISSQGSGTAHTNLPPAELDYWVIRVL